MCRYRDLPFLRCDLRFCSGNCCSRRKYDDPDPYSALGYDLTFSTAIVAVAGGLGVIIPPSIPFIMYGMASGASVSDLFLAGIIPGLMIGAAPDAVCHLSLQTLRRRQRQDPRRSSGCFTTKDFLKVLQESFFALLSPVIILGCIYSGVASPTEAAVISVFYALIISLFVYRSITYPGYLADSCGSDPHFHTDPLHSGSFHCIFQSPDSDAGATDSQ